jgi:hypothetical protein
MCPTRTRPEGVPTMLTATLPFPPSPPAAGSPPRRGRPKNPPPIARDVLEALAALPSTTPTVATLAAALGRTPAELVPVLNAMEQCAQVETWPDAERAGTVRVMLSARTAQRLGLELSPAGDRWRTTRSTAARSVAREAPPGLRRSAGLAPGTTDNPLRNQTSNVPATRCRPVKRQKRNRATPPDRTRPARGGPLPDRGRPPLKNPLKATVFKRTLPHPGQGLAAK